MTSKISCLLPAYNAEQYVEEAVRSIISQTMADWEMIIINDGSNDRTLEIAKALAQQDGRIKILDQENMGIVSALNEGLKLANGKYIARMDADDVSFPDRFRMQFEYLESNPNCVLVGGVATSSQISNPSGVRSTGGRHRVTDLSIFPPKIAVSVHPLIMMRKDALTKIGGYRGTYLHAEDYDLFIRISEHGSIINLPAVLLYYRRHDGAVSLMHLELQERSAANAELEAFQKVSARIVFPIAFEAYVNLRIWRRYTALQSPKAVSLISRGLCDMLRVRGRGVWTRPYARVRLLLAANVLRFLLTKVNAWRESVSP